MDRIELDARMARCGKHLDREGVLDAITEARRAFRAGDLAAARTRTEVAEYAARLTTSWDTQNAARSARVSIWIGRSRSSAPPAGGRP